MTWFAFGFVAGFIAGGLLVDVNLRAPEPVKKWLASWFPQTKSTEKTEA